MIEEKSEGVTSLNVGLAAESEKNREEDADMRSVLGYLN